MDDKIGRDLRRRLLIPVISLLRSFTAIIVVLNVEYQSGVRLLQQVLRELIH